MWSSRLLIVILFTGSFFFSQANQLKIGWSFRNVYASPTIEYRPEFGSIYGIRLGKDLGNRGCVGGYYSDFGLTVLGNENVNQLSLSYSLYRFGFGGWSLTKESKLLTFVGLRSSVYSLRSEPAAAWDLAPHLGFTSITGIAKPITIRSRLTVGHTLLGNMFKGRSRVVMNFEVGLGFNPYQYKRWKRGRESD